MIIAIDFDGTVVTHAYPQIGRFIGSQSVLKELVANGHKLILYTMRGDTYLAQAVKWFKDNEIELYSVNHNPNQAEWTNSPKVYAQLYIDDAALGTPMLQGLAEERPYVDWVKVRELLVERKLIL